MELALKIAKYILTEGGCRYADIQARADAKSISRRELESAMALIHRNKMIKTTHAGGDIHYAVAPLAPKPSPFTRYEPYPPMIAGVNDASHEIFSGCDYGYLFMTPDEMLQYKAQLKGKAYIPRRKHEYT